LGHDGQGERSDRNKNVTKALDNRLGIPGEISEFLWTGRRFIVPYRPRRSEFTPQERKPSFARLMLGK
jgi:hypothetical protein